MVGAFSEVSLARILLCCFAGNIYTLRRIYVCWVMQVKHNRRLLLIFVWLKNMITTRSEINNDICHYLQLKWLLEPRVNHSTKYALMFRSYFPLFFLLYDLLSKVMKMKMRIIKLVKNTLWSYCFTFHFHIIRVYCLFYDERENIHKYQLQLYAYSFYDRMLPNK